MPTRRNASCWTLPPPKPRLTPDVPPQVLMGDIRNGSFDLKLICQAPNAVWAEVQSDLKRALVARARERDLAAGLPAQIVFTASVGTG